MVFINRYFGGLIMNANQKLQQEVETVTNSFVYRNDLSDVHHLASNQMNWLSTLIHVAKKSPDNSKTLLEIAEYLADCFDSEHTFQAKQLEKN